MAIAGLVSEVTAGVVKSEAVTVSLPAVLIITPKTFVPETSAAEAGKVALTSLEVISIISVVLVTTFQY